ncbi:MAG: hypothetical protein DRO88_05445 [Promethearchaeia archaeon]|nr:MAG: hypothetical protein DRO88_05445 [Candidatus Lokiarchaeia archaeon]
MPDVLISVELPRWLPKEIREIMGEHFIYRLAWLGMTQETELELNEFLGMCSKHLYLRYLYANA